MSLPQCALARLSSLRRSVRFCDSPIVCLLWWRLVIASCLGPCAKSCACVQHVVTAALSKRGMVVQTLVGPTEALIRFLRRCFAGALHSMGCDTQSSMVSMLLTLISTILLRYSMTMSFVCVRVWAPCFVRCSDGAGSNSRTGDTNLSKLDAETDVLAHATVSLSLSKSIQKARIEKKWSQAQLAQAINEKPAVINQYESGKALPNNQIISKIERALGTKVRSKK